MFGDVSSHARDCNKTDQTKEHCPWAVLPLWLWAAPREAFPSTQLRAGHQRGASGSRGLSKLVAGQGRTTDPQVLSLLPQSWASAKDGEVKQHGINQLWVEYSYTQGTPPSPRLPRLLLQLTTNNENFSALYWLHWDNTTVKAPAPQCRC